ncbi:hypothetical protein CV_1199 [Chromobacterium violaceum ATCC 12472]|uniref:Uncharacterized protein n=1 Tax=Chromobacterium violaceum (strain ATCC 12472 / DSM 30191 / JCM 1249 / CCUG 213 / NBRC 12614 / NCIMB 9131 / NCTC 9757 / MK) TaxID=243365 RepID=Q7NYS3_CHRVO|nr:hypothetical protein CV_1199 [Chromobacterium violaceum ATCC 12472]
MIRPRVSDTSEADEPAHGFAADAAHGLGVAHLGDADHQRGDHQRGDDHLDQPQENVGEDGHAIDEGFDRGGVIACVLTEEIAYQDAQQHSDQNQGREFFRLHSVVPACS